MQEAEYLHMYEEEERHWWYVGMRKVAASLLSDLIIAPHAAALDVGCGTGYNIGWLRGEYGSHVTGMDLSPHALDFCRRRGEQELVGADAAAIPVKGSIYDLVLCFDVLTNLKDEKARGSAFKEFFRVLKPGGKLIVRVAAYDFLRGSHDTAVMTYHRFGKRELRLFAEAAGFSTLRVTGANTLLFPGAAVWRILKKMGLAPEGSDVRPTTRGSDGLNRALSVIMRLEARLLRFCNLPYGLSFFLLATKPESEIPELRNPIPSPNATATSIRP